MLLRLTMFVRSLFHLASTGIGRLRRGPARPGWTFMHEAVARGMKREFLRLAGLPWPAQRAALRAIAVPPSTVRNAHFERTTLAGMPAQWVSPKGGGAPTAVTVLYLHGGAYLFGSVDEYRAPLALLAQASGARIIAIDYRLAPEHPFPAALEDALAAYKALLASGVSPARLVIAGDSAGGGLTASLLCALRDLEIALPAAAALICPWVDLAARGGSMVSNEPYDVFTADLVDSWAREVLAGADPEDPRASPMRADLRGLPPILVHVGDVEVIRDQVVEFAERARAAGVSVRLVVQPDAFHNWHMYAAVLAEGRRAIQEVGAFIASVDRSP